MAGRKPGGHNSFRKPKKITGRNTGRPPKGGGHPPWRPGESGNPKGRPKGSGALDLHRVFHDMLAVEDEKTRRTNMQHIFDRLMKDIESPTRRAQAARILLAWGIGQPNQQLKVTQAVDILIGVMPGVDDTNLEAGNVEIFRGEDATKPAPL